MLLNKGELDGKRILKPETVKVAMTNHIGDKTLDGRRRLRLGRRREDASRRASARPRRTAPMTGSASTGRGSGSTTNNIGFVGMIQRRGNGGPGAINLRGESQQLVYKALVK